MNEYPSLELDDGFFPGVLSGSITATVRIGERLNVNGGPLIFKAARGGYLPLLVSVDRITRTTLLGISESDARLAGYVDDAEARRLLSLIYPEAELDTPFTVIQFSRVL